MLPNHPNGYPGGINNNGNWPNQVPNPYLPSTPVNGVAPTSGALAIRGTEDYVLTPDEERQLLRTKQIVEEMLTRSRHNKEKAELEARLYVVYPIHEVRGRGNRLPVYTQSGGGQ